MTFLFIILRLLCQALTVAIFIRSVMSWGSSGQHTTLAIILYRVTEPILAPLRRIIPRVGMLDFSPMAAIVLLQLIAYLLP
jgi:YggT family protein